MVNVNGTSYPSWAPLTPDHDALPVIARPRPDVTA
jgi:hypothetical protein